MAGFQVRYTATVRRGFFKVGVVLARVGVTANALTYLGLLLVVFIVPLILGGHFVWAVVVGLAGGFCDLLDGAVARAGVGPTKAGAFLDSTTDRIAELLVSGAFVVYFARLEQWWPVVAALVFMGASQMVSYTRARAEALGVDCKVGYMARGERLALLAVGMLLSGWHIGSLSVLVLILYVLAVLTALTVVQRMVYVMRKLRAADDGPPAPAA